MIHTSEKLFSCKIEVLERKITCHYCPKTFKREKVHSSQKPILLVNIYRRDVKDKEMRYQTLQKCTWMKERRFLVPFPAVIKNGLGWISGRSFPLRRRYSATLDNN